MGQELAEHTVPGWGVEDPGQRWIEVPSQWEGRVGGKGELTGQGRGGEAGATPALATNHQAGDGLQVAFSSLCFVKNWSTCHMGHGTGAYDTT